MAKYSIPYGRQHVTDEDIKAVADVLKSDYLTQGSKVKEFEQAFAHYVDAKYAVSVSSGTAALHLANLALGLKKGQKVLTTPTTFAATANSVLFCGAEVDFIDIDPDTYLMDLGKLEDKLSSVATNTYVGVIPVDLAGLSVDTEKLRKIAKKYSLWIIEDACHAPGGYFIDSEGRKVLCGSNYYADLSCFSFHPVKHITTGEGGMVTTNDERIYKKLLRLRSHGITKEGMPNGEGGWYHEMRELGYNYRLPDINCALGLSQLKRAQEGLLKRQQIAAHYNLAFQRIDKIKIQAQPSNKKNAYHLFIIEVEDRKKLYDHLQQNNIFVQIHYLPTHLHPYYKSLGWGEGNFPYAEKYYNRCISLPMFPTLAMDEQKYVIQQVLEFYNG